MKGAKKLLAVAAAQGVSRSLEPRIGNKRSVQEDFFYATGRRQSYDDARDLHALDMHRDRERDVPQSTGSRASTTTSLTSSSSSSSSSSSNISMNSSRNNYPCIERQSLSSAEIKLERMQKAALEKAEKVRKVVEEKAAKIRKLAEEKANKLRCLAEEKVADVTLFSFIYTYTSDIAIHLSCCLAATTVHRLSIRESLICANSLIHLDDIISLCAYNTHRLALASLSLSPPVTSSLSLSHLPLIITLTILFYSPLVISSLTCLLLTLTILFFSILGGQTAKDRRREG